MPFCIHEIMSSLRRTFPGAAVSNYKSAYSGDDEIRCSDQTIELEGYRDGGEPLPNYLLNGVFVGTYADAVSAFDRFFAHLKSFHRHFQFEIYDDSKTVVLDRIDVES